MEKKDFKTNATGYEFLKRNQREEKPRKHGLTGRNYFEDLLRTVGNYIDSIKFAGGSFTLMPPDEVKAINDLAHEYGVMVSTGGFIEHVIPQGKDAVKNYIETSRDLGFDIIEISAGFISLPTDDWLRLVEDVIKAGVKAKPEIGIQFGAGGDTPGGQLESEGVQDVGYAIKQAKRFLDAGAYMIPWRVEVPASFINEIGLEKLMFEAAEPEVFEWYIKNYGAEVNLFVDHSQIVQLECYRTGIWGTSSIWGRVLTYK